MREIGRENRGKRDEEMGCGHDKNIVTWLGGGDKV